MLKIAAGVAAGILIAITIFTLAPFGILALIGLGIHESHEKSIRIPKPINRQVPIIHRQVPIAHKQLPIVHKVNKNNGIPLNMINRLNPVKQAQNVIYTMGESNLENAKRVQAYSDKRMRDLANKHDNEHPSAFPEEWDTIKNKIKICWIHKKTRKKVCEKIEG